MFLNANSLEQRDAKSSAGYYVVNYKSMAPLQTLFGQMWKEYALSDSRYLTQDPFVLCMEGITAVSPCCARVRVALV